MIKKKLLSIIALCALSATTALGAIAGTVAWFNDKITIEEGDNLKGNSLGAYFAYGDGTSGPTEQNPHGGPFGITKPRHLYNLAWLQYLGKYFKDDEGNFRQCYFKIDNDLDMSEYVLPPIGTSKFPFIGFIDGGNNVIYNVTVSNNISDFNQSLKPSSVKAIQDCNIIGLFGVVGEIDGDSYSTVSQVPSVSNIGVDDITLKSNTQNLLIGAGAGYVNGKVSNFAIGNANFDISKYKNDQAQYIAPVHTTYSNGLSKYGTVGYVTPEYRSFTDITDVKAFQPNVENGVAYSGNLYGASIPMEKMFNRIKNKLNRQNLVAYQNEVQHIDKDGAFVDGYPQYSNPTTLSSSKTAVEIDSQGNQISSYTIYDPSNTSYMYLYGYPESPETVNRTLDVYRESAVSDGFQITFTDSNGTTHYLANNNGSVADATTGGSNTIWHWSGSKVYNQLGSYETAENYYLYISDNALRLSTSASTGQSWSETTNGSYKSIKTSSGNSGTVVFNRNAWRVSGNYVTSGTNKYLSTDANYSSLEVANNEAQATMWYGSNNSVIYTVDNSGGIKYINNTPSLTNSNSNALKRNGTNISVTITSWLIFSTTYYLNLNGNSWSITETSGSASSFTFSEAKANCNIVPVASSLLYSSSSSTVKAKYEYKSTYFPLSYTNTSNDEAGYNEGSDVSFTNTGYVVSGANYETSNARGDIRVSQYGVVNNYSNPSFSAYNLGQSFAGSPERTSYPDSDNVDFDILTRTSETNGYVKIKDKFNASSSAVNTKLTDQNYPKKWYGKTDPSTAAAGLKLTSYEKARQGFHDSMKGATNLYGLHFMNSEISTNNLIDVDYALVNGKLYKGTKEYELTPRMVGNKTQTDAAGNILYDVAEEGVEMGGKYQLPQDCIDFNLSKNGTINFFAGSYFPNNSTFFSLHRIFRDGPSIIDIKEIRNVYLNGQYNPLDAVPQPKYVYEYADGTYSSGTISGNSLFDLSWITDDAGIDDLSIISGTTTYGTCFYFEIPLMEGEYALGSVPGKSGAYLMYLDIGAAGSDTDKTVVTEKIITEINTLLHPAGFEFVHFEYAVNDNKRKYSFVPGAGFGFGGATIEVPDEFSGNLDISYANSTLTCGPENGSTISATISSSSFAGDGVQIVAKDNSGNSNTITPTGDTVLTVLEREITYTYDSNNEKLKTVYSDKINGGDSQETLNVTETVTNADYDKTRLPVYTESVTPGAVRYVEFKYYSEQNKTELSHVYRYDGDNESETAENYIFDWMITAVDNDVIVHAYYATSLDGMIATINDEAIPSSVTVQNPKDVTVIAVTLPQQSEENQEQSGS